MSNAEHLIENAIYDIKKGIKFEEFKGEWRNNMTDNSLILLYNGDVID